MNDNPAEEDDDSLDQHPPMPPIPSPGQAPPPLAVAAVPGALTGTPMAAGHPMAVAAPYGHHHPHYPQMAGMIPHHAHTIPGGVPGHDMTPHYSHAHTQVHQSIPGANIQRALR